MAFSDRRHKNSCSEGREGQGSLTWVVSDWCERGELNPHGLPRQILSLMRLPFRHSRTHGCACMTERKWSRCRDLNPGPLGPEPSALPNCATPRPRAHTRHIHSIEHGFTRVKRFPESVSDSVSESVPESVGGAPASIASLCPWPSVDVAHGGIGYYENAS